MSSLDYGIVTISGLLEYTHYTDLKCAACIDVTDVATTAHQLPPTCRWYLCEFQILARPPHPAASAAARATSAAPTAACALHIYARRE